MTTDLASRDAVIWDIDGVKYDEKAISNLYPLCDQSCAEAAVHLLPELSYDDAHILAKRSYDVYGDCLSAFVDWATENGRPAHVFQQALFELYHTTLLRYLWSEHKDVFAPRAETIAEFAKRPHIRHGSATHSFIDGYAAPLLDQLGISRFFNRSALIGMDMVGFARKSQDVASLELSMSRLGTSPETAIFVEDNLKNLDCAKRLLPDLVTVFMHHGRPLASKPSYVDYQFANNRELMQAINSSAPRVIYSLT